MRAGGRCQRATSRVLLGLLALSCERGESGEGAPLPGTAGASAAASFDLATVEAELATSSRVEGEPVLLPGSGAYAQLRAGASDVELRELLRHASPVVRVAAFWTLAERNPARAPFTELSALLSDATVVRLEGSRPRKSTVADLALECVAGRLSLAERDAVAEQLLTARSTISYAARIRREWTFGSALHEPLRALARAGEGDVLPALARYRDPADVPLLAAALREPTAEYALQAIAEFPDAAFVAPLQAYWRELQEPNAQALCQFYATALRFPVPVADAFLAAPFARGVRPADAAAHLTCQRWVLSPELIRQHPEAGFRLWERDGGLVIGQVKALAEADPARVRRLIASNPSALGRSTPEAATWVLRQTAGEERVAALRGLRVALRRAKKKELDNLGDVLRGLQWRELLPDLFDRLERSRPLADASMATFQDEITRSVVWQLTRWQLSDPERQRLLSWVLGGREARERDTKDPIGQRIVEDYLVDVLTRAGLLRPS